MTTPKSITKAGLLLVCTAAAFLAFVSCKDDNEIPRKIVCVLDVKDHDDTTKALVTGYNYTLLKIFSREKGFEEEIFFSQNDENHLDSLENGVDIVVLPYPSEVKKDSFFVSSPVDSLSLWVCSAKDKSLSRKIEEWVKDYTSKPYYDSLHSRYTDHFFNPYLVLKKGIKRSFLSPYDNLFRQYADSLGWDWRLFAAMVYQESRFRIDARSHKGAAGLMQMIPSTADRYEIEDIICPEDNIATGTRYLKHIQYLFHRRCPDKEDLKKVTLAAYTAGESHIRDCFYYLNWKGSESKTWNDVVSIMPEMAKEETAKLDTIKSGTFNVDQTLEYVEKVYSYFKVFKEICPDATDSAPSSKGQPSL